MMNRIVSYSQFLLIILLPLIVQSTASNRNEEKLDKKVLKRVARSFLDRFDRNDQATHACISSCTYKLHLQHKYSMSQAETFCNGYCFSRQEYRREQEKRLSQLSFQSDSTEQRPYTTRDACEIDCLSTHMHLKMKERNQLCRAKC